MSLIADPTMVAIQRGMDLREQRERILTANLANVDTPRFVPMDIAGEGHIESIETHRAWGTLDLQRTHAAHRSVDSQSALVLRAEAEERPDATSSLDMNQVDLDAQVAKFSDNAVRLSAVSELARRRFALLNYAVSKMSGGG